MTPEYSKHFQEVSDKTAFTLSAKTDVWGLLFENEKIQLVLAVMALLEDAYDEGFTQAEHEYDGYQGLSGWTNRNPYRGRP